MTIGNASSKADQILTGTLRADLMLGGSGNDRITGSTGNDVITFANNALIDVSDFTLG